MHNLRCPACSILFLFSASLGGIPAGAETAVILNSGDESISLVDTITQPN